jgi:branched-chain amino acid transport system permease protein
MTDTTRNFIYFTGIAALIVGTGLMTSWNLAITIMNFGLISAIMALGVNLQWGFAGLFNVGIMGFVALGGLATVLISMPPVDEAWSAGGLRVVLALVLGAATIVGAILAYNALPKGRVRTVGMIALLIAGFFIYRARGRGGQPRKCWLPWWSWPAGSVGMASRWGFGRRSSLDHRQDSTWPAL